MTLLSRGRDYSPWSKKGGEKGCFILFVFTFFGLTLFVECSFPAVS